MSVFVLAAAVTAAFSFGEVKVDCPQPGDWKVDLVRETAADGAEIAKIVLDAPAPAKPPVFTVAFALPQVDIDSRWYTIDGRCLGTDRPTTAGLYITRGRKVAVK